MLNFPISKKQKLLSKMRGFSGVLFSFLLLFSFFDPYMHMRSAIVPNMSMTSLS